jgi:hypothetical protein
MVIQLIICVVLMAIRNMLLVALVILSPIAFVLGILPNTNKLFKKWFEMFGHMLLVYPAVMLLFAVSKLVAQITINSADISMMTLPIYLATLAAPVFFVKKIITSTSKVMGAVSAGVSKAVGGVAAVGMAAATGGAAGALVAAGKQMGSGAGQAAEGIVDASAASHARGGKNPFARTFGRSKINNMAKTADNAAITSAVASGQSSESAVQSVEDARVNKANDSEASVASNNDLEKTMTSGTDAGKIAAAHREYKKRGLKLSGEARENFIANTAKVADTKSTQGRAALNAAGDEMQEAGTFNAATVQDYRGGGNNGGRGYDKAGQEAAIYDKAAAGISDEQYIGMSNDAREAMSKVTLDRIKNTTMGTKERADAMEVRRKLAQTEKNIRGNDVLKGRMAEGDYKITTGKKP